MRVKILSALDISELLLAVKLDFNYVVLFCIHENPVYGPLYALHYTAEKVAIRHHITTVIFWAIVASI